MTAVTHRVLGASDRLPTPSYLFAPPAMALSMTHLQQWQQDVPSLRRLEVSRWWNPSTSLTGFAASKRVLR